MAQALASNYGRCDWVGVEDLPVHRMRGQVGVYGAPRLLLYTPSGVVGVGFPPV